MASRKKASPPRRPQPLPPAAGSLAIARLVILAGVLVVGLVAWLRHRDGGVPADPALAGRLTWAVGAAWLLGVGGVLALRLAWSRAADAGHRRRLTVVGWAVGEIPALAGGLHYWLTGDSRPFSAGLLFLLLCFFLFSSPVERR